MPPELDDALDPNKPEDLSTINLREVAKKRLRDRKSALKAMAELLEENFKLRHKNSELRKALESSPGVAEGAVVLQGDDVAKWNVVSKITLTPDEIVSAIQQKEELQGKLDKIEADKIFTTAASVVGFKPDVLTDLASIKGFKVIVKEEEAEGVKKNVAYALDGEGKEVELNSFVETNLSSYLPSLKVGEETKESKKVLFPTQKKSDSTTVSPLDAFRERKKKEQEAKVNPLQKK